MIRFHLDLGVLSYQFCSCCSFSFPRMPTCTFRSKRGFLRAKPSEEEGEREREEEILLRKVHLRRVATSYDMDNVQLDLVPDEELGDFRLSLSDPCVFALHVAREIMVVTCDMALEVWCESIGKFAYSLRAFARLEKLFYLVYRWIGHDGTG